MHTNINRYAFVAIFTAFLMWGLGVTSLMSWWSGIMIKNYWQVEEEKRETQKEIELTEVYYENYLLTKKQIRLIRNGMSDLEKHQFKDGITKLFYAKTIFPNDLEARFFLMYGFMNACEQTGSYCGNAQREIQHTYNFIRKRPLGDFQKKRVDCYANWWNRVRR